MPSFIKYEPFTSDGTIFHRFILVRMKYQDTVPIKNWCESNIPQAIWIDFLPPERGFSRWARVITSDDNAAALFKLFWVSE